MLFNILKNIIQLKRPQRVNDEEIVPVFMINRWLSMYSAEMAFYVNEISNHNILLFDDTNEYYEYLSHAIPAQRFRGINYIKKQKNEPRKFSDEEENSIRSIQKQYFISKEDAVKMLNL